ncbi:Helix-turn-helix domain-containing protein [Sinosporangium album]|uniref:Helix-turn-helix domain-containing protein n=1 Tax=Sinosporangium album TaxID=504805 RepID=A0A1G7T3H5_9ACTN|nr:winged helix-turn-helix domain-containing protein [Sinosporangium album]SDG29886.1 Helix-turn-helix domain-containing protein [Sinosporangium album]
MQAGMPQAPDDSGLVAYGGEVKISGYEWSWQMARSPSVLLSLPAAPLAAVLAAAGHPARFEILRILIRGPRPIAELQSELGLSSPGQLYHHLKTLSGVGLIHQPERGVYQVPGKMVFPVLAFAAAATDVAGPALNAALADQGHPGSEAAAPFNPPPNSP